MQVVTERDARSQMGLMENSFSTTETSSSLSGRRSSCAVASTVALAPAAAPRLWPLRLRELGRAQETTLQLLHGLCANAPAASPCITLMPRVEPGGAAM